MIFGLHFAEDVAEQTAEATRVGLASLAIALLLMGAGDIGHIAAVAACWRISSSSALSVMISYNGPMHCSLAKVPSTRTPSGSSPRSSAAMRRTPAPCTRAEG